MTQRTGTMRGEIAGHGQYETTFKAFEALQDQYDGWRMDRLVTEIKELQGDPEYDTEGLTRTEMLLILAELNGHATN